MFSQYQSDSRSMFTYVTASGVTFSVLGDGTLFGGASAFSRRVVARIRAGKLLVSTPHRAGGAFSERAAGGVYSSVKASAKWLTLEEWIARDPRATDEDRAQALAAIEARYAN